MKKTIKVNLGSGPVGIDGWINYDSGVLPLLSKFPKLRRVICALRLLPKSYDVSWPKITLHDIRKKFPLGNNSVDYIYCSQVLEHFEKYEAENILKEVLRVLKPNGSIRISVPDIAKIFSVYSKLLKSSPDSAARETNITWWGFEKDLPSGNIFSKISKMFIRDHQWHYDKRSIRQLLKEAGFKNIMIYSFRKGRVPDLNKLELEKHEPHSLYVEAIK